MIHPDGIAPELIGAHSRSTNDLTPIEFTLIVAAPVFVKLALNSITIHSTYDVICASIANKYAFELPVVVP